MFTRFVYFQQHSKCFTILSQYLPIITVILGHLYNSSYNNSRNRITETYFVYFVFFFCC